MRGEHRIRNNKRYLYEESARVPFIARGPGIARSDSSDGRGHQRRPGADDPRADRGRPGSRPGRRVAVRRACRSPKLEHGRAILLEAYAGDQIIGLRTSRYLYTEWDTGRRLPEIELYDTYTDPSQLDNLAGDPGLRRRRRRARATSSDELIDCAGADCRERPERPSSAC